MRRAGWESEEVGTTSSRCQPVSGWLCSPLCIQDLAEQLQVLQVLGHVTVCPTEVTSLLSKTVQEGQHSWALPATPTPMDPTHRAECPHCPHPPRRVPPLAPPTLLSAPWAPPPRRVPPWAPPHLQSAPIGPTHLAECPHGPHPLCRVPPWAPPTSQSAPMGPTHFAECPHWPHPTCRVPPWAPPTSQSAPIGPTHLAESPHWPHPPCREPAEPSCGSVALAFVLPSLSWPPQPEIQTEHGSHDSTRPHPPHPTHFSACRLLCCLLLHTLLLQ